MSGSNEDAVMVPRADYDIGLRSTRLLNDLLSNPATVARAEELVTIVNPTAKFPNRDARQAVLEPVRAELEAERAARKTLEDRLNAREEKEAAETKDRDEKALLARIEATKAKRGFSDEMMEKVLTRMRDQNNPDVEAAAAYVADTLPKPAPATGHDFLPANLDPYGLGTADEAFKSLHQDPSRWQDKELRAIVNDPEFLRLGQQ